VNPRKTISIDLRQRILGAYDEGNQTRSDVAKRFRVSLGFVKKLLFQRQRTGDIAPRHHHSGRRPTILESDRQKVRALVIQTPDMTLAEVRSGAGLACTLTTIHRILASMNFSFKKNA